MDNIISNIEKASAKNDYHHELIKDISNRTNLSEYALFTRLRINDKISFNNYQAVRATLENRYLKDE